MTSSSRMWILGVLGCVCFVHSVYLFPNSYRAIAGFMRVRELSNVDRRILLRGNWYRDVLAIQEPIPANASARLVSAAPPWYLAYYFYPRLLKQGSTDLHDVTLVRQRYPADWVLVYAEEPPVQMKAYPPMSAEKF